MIKRAKRLALDIFSNLKNAYSSKSRDNKQKQKASNNEEGEITSTTDNKQLRHTSSTKSLKRNSINKKKLKQSRQASKSLPSALNTDPLWQALRDRSKSDPSAAPLPSSSSSSPTHQRRHNRSRSLSSSSSSSPPPLTRRKSILKKKFEGDFASASEKVSPNTDKVQDPFQVSFSVEEGPLDASLGVKLEEPIIIEEMKSPNGRNDWADRRKATSFLNVQEAVRREDSFDRHNQEIMAIWDTMMTREIEEVNAKYDAEKRELLEEILARETAQAQEAESASTSQAQAPANASPTHARRTNVVHVRKGSAVAFNNTVEVCVMGDDGGMRSTSTTELFTDARARPLSRNSALRKQALRKPSPLSLSMDAPLPSAVPPIPSPKGSPLQLPPSPKGSPVQFPPSPKGSPRQFPITPISTPPISPIIDPPKGSPRKLPLTPISTPPVSPIITPPKGSPRQLPASPLSTPPLSPISSIPSPTLSPILPVSSPSSSFVPRLHSSLEGPSKPKAPVRPWAKVLGGRAHKTWSDEVGGHALERAMEEEIAQVEERCAREKLEILEEIEDREICEVSTRSHAKRSELLLEIAQREAQLRPKASPRERRHAIKIRNTLAQRAASGIETTLRKGGAESSPKEADDQITNLKISAEFSFVGGGSGSLKVWRKNASLRAVSRNATRKNLWLAEAPRALI